jgi:ethanolamine ammonia-lyase small subunit
MNIPRLRDFTSARVSLGRAGNSLPTHELLKLQLAHARARQAVHSKLDLRLIGLDLKPVSQDVLVVRSAVPDRPTYLRRPDLGRQLNDDSRHLLIDRKEQYDVVFVIVDGLSAVAIQVHAVPMLQASLGLLKPSEWRLAPFVIVEQGRVAIGDEVGHCLGAALAVVLIGERPGLSYSDSLGIYLTWDPHPGLNDANRNCISNVRAEGLSYHLAAHKLVFLMEESRRKRLSGFQLKEDAKWLE